MKSYASIISGVLVVISLLFFIIFGSYSLDGGVQEDSSEINVKVDTASRTVSILPKKSFKEAKITLKFNVEEFGEMEEDVYVGDLTAYTQKTVSIYSEYFDTDMHIKSIEYDADTFFINVTACRITAIVFLIIFCIFEIVLFVL